MLVRRWDPFREMRWMQANMDQMRRGFSPAGVGNGEGSGWAIPLNVVQDGENIVVHAAMPGIDPSDLSVTIEDDVLTIRGQTASEGEREDGKYLVREMHSGSFYRSLRLPDTLDADKAQTCYDHGVLTISLPRLEARQARQLSINVGGGNQVNEGEKTEA